MKLKQQGFTLIELVIVIVILGAIGIATSSYIATGITIYTDIAERDRELNSLRFVMERLRRDVINALPNSLFVTTEGTGDVKYQCLTFTPIKASTIYNYDFPIAPLSALSGSIASIEGYTFEEGDRAAIYLLNASELDGDNVQNISALADETITFDSEVSFPLSSPNKRLYVIGASQHYYYFNDSDELMLSDECFEGGSVMANDIKGLFVVDGATLQRNGLVKITFYLDFDGQEVPIEQVVHIRNVP